MTLALRQNGIRHRPRPTPLHVAGALSPTAAMASKVALERDVPQRIQRLRDAAKDALGQRRRPSRDRMRALTVGPVYLKQLTDITHRPGGYNFIYLLQQNRKEIL